MNGAKYREILEEGIKVPFGTQCMRRDIALTFGAAGSLVVRALD